MSLPAIGEAHRAGHFSVSSAVEYPGERTTAEGAVVMACSTELTRFRNSTRGVSVQAYNLDLSQRSQATARDDSAPSVQSRIHQL